MFIRGRLPRKLTALLSSSQIQKIHHIALGFEDSFLITWRDKNGKDRIDCAGLPTELTTFIYAKNAQHQLTRDIPAIRCVLGPYNASFFVHDSVAYLWMNIPGGLLDALQSRIKGGAWVDRPRIVALGADDNFLLVTESNAAIWELKNYKAISDMLNFSNTQDRGIEEIHNIVLHPYRYGCFIAQSKNGTLLYDNLPPHQLPGLKQMTAPISQDTDRAGTLAMQRRESEKKESTSRRPSALQERARIRREWSEHKQQFTAQAKGLKLSLSLSVSAGGLARMLG